MSPETLIVADRSGSAALTSSIDLEWSTAWTPYRPTSCQNTCRNKGGEVSHCGDTCSTIVGRAAARVSCVVFLLSFIGRRHDSTLPTIRFRIIMMENAPTTWRAPCLRLGHKSRHTPDPFSSCQDFTAYSGVGDQRSPHVRLYHSPMFDYTILLMSDYTTYLSGEGETKRKPNKKNHQKSHKKTKKGREGIRRRPPTKERVGFLASLSPSLARRRTRVVERRTTSTLSFGRPPRPSVQLPCTTACHHYRTLFTPAKVRPSHTLKTKNQNQKSLYVRNTALRRSRARGALPACKRGPQRPFGGHPQAGKAAKGRRYCTKCSAPLQRRHRSTPGASATEEGSNCPFGGRPSRRQEGCIVCSDYGASPPAPGIGPGCLCLKNRKGSTACTDRGPQEEQEQWQGLDHVS